MKVLKNCLGCEYPHLRFLNFLASPEERKEKERLQTLKTDKKVRDYAKQQGLPNANIVEGTMTIQCCCPVCEYGDGYNKSILVYPLSRLALLTCKTCGTRFLGLD